MVLDDAPPPPPAAPRQAAGQPVVLDDPPPPPPAAPIAPPFDPRPGSLPVTLDEPPPPPRAPAAAIAPPFDPNAGAQPVVLGEAPPSPAAPQPVLAAPPAPAPDLATSILETAEELVIAPDVRPHETRFSDLPPSSNIARDLSEIEFSNRAPALKPASLAPEPPSATTLSQLPLFPLFAEVPKDALAALTQQSEIIELEDGNVLMRKGDPADALYGIVEGSVQVQIPGQNLKLTLAEGDVFGESCLLPGERRHADVIVLGHVLALKVPRETLNTLIGSYPRLAEVLLELLTRRLLGNLLQASPLFQEFDARGRQELAKTFEVRRAGGGTKLAEMGKVMDGLYISLTGTLRVTDASGNNADFGPGTMFGQGSLLTHEPSSVHVTALANMVLLRMPSESFHTLAMQFPSILMTVSELEPVAKVSF